MLTLAAGLFLAGSAHGFGGLDPSEAKAAADAAFAEADADGSGSLSAAEFAQFHEIFRATIEAKRFAALDTNGDGALTKEELEAGRPTGRGGRHHGPGF
jgi:Ca2+-binding EF-hand superfamily protein